MKKHIYKKKFFDQFFLPLRNIFNFNKNGIISKEDLKKYIQELKEVQTQLIQAEKLSIIGERVSSIVHDLSNPLSVLIGSVTSIQELIVNNKLDMGGLEKSLYKILKSVTRIQSSVDHIKNLARSSNQKLIETNLNEVINSAFLMVETELKYANIHVIKELSSTLPAIFGDPNELEQVIINLISNAKDSMTAIKRENPAYKAELKIVSRSTKDGAEIVIKDNGKGITEEIKSKLFTPFFTTKEYGKGTGLGLSISKKIIERHGAKISVESTPGTSTSFTLSFKKEEINA
jgi:C4-dicarboxylate-specific signal transduction histidine kinase